MHGLKVEAFKQFIAGVKERCEEPPVTVEMRIIGWFDGGRPAS